MQNSTFICSQVEDNSSYEVTTEETSDRGNCARALYDYQAGEFFQIVHTPL